jgi:hypothetical protein
MGKGRERQITSRPTSTRPLSKWAWGENFKRNQVARTRTEPFPKAMFLKLNTLLPLGANPRSGWTAPGTASGPALFSDRGVTVVTWGCNAVALRRNWSFGPPVTRNRPPPRRCVTRNKDRGRRSCRRKGEAQARLARLIALERFASSDELVLAHNPYASRKLIVKRCRLENSAEGSS